jgi:hypothetical protein
MKGNDDVTFSNTLTNSALDDLKIKHDDALKNQYENKVFTSNLKNDNHYFYAKKSEGSPLDGFHVEESESEYRYYELERQNSKVKLIDKRY